MQLRRIRILAIAPNEKIQSSMYQVAERFDDVSITAYVGNLHRAAELIRQHQDEGFDVVIARGETAAMIRRITALPVLEIEHTFYDVLHAIKLAETFGEPYAILGFSSVTSSAHRLRDLLQLDFDIYTLSSVEEASSMVDAIRQRDIRLIICGMSVDYIIRRYGLKTVLISSSEDSIRSTINQSISVCRAYIGMKRDSLFYQAVLGTRDDDVLVLDEHENLLFSFVRQLDRETALSLVKEELKGFDLTDDDTIKTRSNQLVRIKRRILQFEGSHFVVFYLSLQKSYMPYGRGDILYYGRAEASETYLKHYNEVFPAGYETDYSMDQLMASPLPILMFGEHGTGREQLAAYLYTNGRLKHRPYVVVNFQIMNERSWSHLINHVNSPLNSNKTTLYFRGLEALPLSKVEYLHAMIQDTNLCSRNRIFFSYTTAPGKPVENAVMHMMQQLSCLSVHLTPLRQRREIMPALASLYISTLNLSLFKQVIGFTPEAMAALQQYSWPNNLPQFKRVLTQLVSASYSSYIQREHVLRILAVEDKNLNYSSPVTEVVRYHGTLQDIERDIVRAVLAENGGNQSQTARQLGISRTTLWKMLRDPSAQ